MLADDVIQRLKEMVPALSNRVEGVASLVQLMQQNLLPQHTPAARVMASGIRGGQPDAAAGLFRQAIDRTVSIYLVYRNVQGDGGNQIDGFDTDLEGVIAAICGWAPGDQVGVFRLVNGGVQSMAAGTLVYQIDFAIGDQLRIAS